MRQQSTPLHYAAAGGFLPACKVLLEYGASVLAILTEWDEFKWLDLDKVAEVMAAKRVVDGRNLMDRNPLVRRGFVLEGIGR